MLDAGAPLALLGHSSRLQQQLEAALLGGESGGSKSNSGRFERGHGHHGGLNFGPASALELLVRRRHLGEERSEETSGRCALLSGLLKITQAAQLDLR